MFVTYSVDLNIFHLLTFVVSVVMKTRLPKMNMQLRKHSLTRVHATVTIWNTGVNINSKVLEMNLNIYKYENS